MAGWAWAYHDAEREQSPGHPLQAESGGSGVTRCNSTNVA